MHSAKELLQKYEKRSWEDIFTFSADFPQPITLKENKDYVRKVLQKTVKLTSDKEHYQDVSKLDKSADFFKYQSYILLIFI